MKHKLRELEDDFTDYLPKEKGGSEDYFDDSYSSNTKNKEDYFEDEGIEDDEPELDTSSLKQKILSLKSKRKRKENNDSIFEDEEVM